MPQLMVNVDSGKPEYVPDAQVQKAWQSGTHTFYRGSTLPVVTPEGKAVRVDSAHAGKALQAGWRVASPEEEQKQALHDKYGGTVGAVGAAAAGVARGVTLGAFDVAANLLGFQGKLRALKEEHPLPSAGGEVVGAVGPMLVPGAQEAAGVRLAAEAKALGGAGEAALGVRALEAARAEEAAATAWQARRIAEHGYGDLAAQVRASEWAASAVRPPIREVARTLEGAKKLASGPIDMGAEIRASAAMGEAPVATAEARAFGAADAARAIGAGPRLVARFGEGAERAVASIVGEGSPRLAIRLGQQLAKKSVAAAAEGAIYGVAEGVSEASLTDDYDNLAQKLVAHATHGAILGGALGGGFGILGELGSTLSRKASPKLQELAGRQAFGALNPSVKMVREAEEYGGVAKVGQTLLDEGVVGLGDKFTTIAKKLEERAKAGLDGHLLFAREVVTDAAARMEAKSMQFGAKAALGTLGLVTHGPVGMAAGLAAGVLKDAVRERGNATVAVLLDKLSSLGGLKRAAVAVDREVDSHIDSIFGRKTARGPKPKTYGSDTDEEYNARVDAVSRGAANLAQHRAEVEKLAGPMNQFAPNTSTAFSRTVTAATAYLAAQIPRGQASLPPSLQPQFDKPAVSMTDKTEFNRVARVVDGGPSVILANMAKGIPPTKSEVAASKQLFGAMHAEVARKLQVEINHLDKPMPIATKHAVEKFFGFVDQRSMRPQYTKVMNSTWAPKAGGAGGGGGKGKHPNRAVTGLDADLRIGAGMPKK